MFTGPVFRDALVAALEANATLGALIDPPLEVTGYAAPIDSPASDILEVGLAIRDTNEFVSIGTPGPRLETVALECQLRVIRSGSGADALGPAEERIGVVFDQVAVELNDPAAAGWVPGAQIVGRMVTDRDYSPFPSDAGAAPVWTAAVLFNVVYQARRN